MAFICFCGCSEEISIEAARHELMQKDVEFSNLSAKRGAKAAFLEYMHDECILLRPESMPIAGRDSIEALLSGFNPKHIMTWKPLAAEVSSSGDLGYTYGTYSLHSGTNVFKGTYVTIWKKDSDGNWKMILDSGNEGLAKKINPGR